MAAAGPFSAPLPGSIAISAWKLELCGWGFVPEQDAADRFALIGVRACDLHAIAIQDRVFLDGPHIDPHYQAHPDPLAVFFSLT